MQQYRRSLVAPLAPRSQRGAALVIGLILLLVLTVLAVSGITTASSELLMAGNEQARQNVFQTAEVGIEQTIVQATFNPDPAAGNQSFNGVTPNTVSDSYVTTIAPNGSTDGYLFWSDNDFTTYYFDIRSVGTAARGARAVHEQGVAWVAPKDSSEGCLPGLPCDGLNAPGP